VQSKRRESLERKREDPKAEEPLLVPHSLTHSLSLSPSLTWIISVPSATCMSASHANHTKLRTSLYFSLSLSLHSCHSVYHCSLSFAKQHVLGRDTDFPSLSVLVQTFRCDRESVSLPGSFRMRWEGRKERDV
jgi:hypothetical protein